MGRFLIIAGLLLQGTIPSSPCYCAPVGRPQETAGGCCHQQRPEPPKWPCCKTDEPLPDPAKSGCCDCSICPCILGTESQPPVQPAPAAERVELKPAAWLAVATVAVVSPLTTPSSLVSGIDHTCLTHQERQAQLSVWLN